MRVVSFGAKRDLIFCDVNPIDMCMCMCVCVRVRACARVDIYFGIYSEARSIHQSDAMENYCINIRASATFAALVQRADNEPRQFAR